MKPVTVSTTVSKSRDEVFDFLDLLANHEGFMDHLFVDWSFSGPPRGVGAKTRVRVTKPGRATNRVMRQTALKAPILVIPPRSRRPCVMRSAK